MIDLFGPSETDPVQTALYSIGFIDRFGFAFDFFSIINYVFCFFSKAIRSFSQFAVCNSFSDVFVQTAAGKLFFCPHFAH